MTRTFQLRTSPIIRVDPQETCSLNPFRHPAYHRGQYLSCTRYPSATSLIMDSEDPRIGLSADENSGATSEAAQASGAAPPSSHEPQILCRPTNFQNSGESSNSIRFEFLAEGAANAVFRVVPCQSQGNQKTFVFGDAQGTILSKEKCSRKVLRMSKGKPKTLKYKEIMEGFEDVVKPLFRKTEPSQERPPDPSTVSNLRIDESFEEFIMEHEGVAIAPEALAALIAEMHTHCPNNRHIEPHYLEERGILLPDMSSIPGSVTTIEIKPKWLLQSPNAPRDAYLCRNCALHASRESGKPISRTWICPLALAAGDKTSIKPYVYWKAQQAQQRAPGDHVLRMYKYFDPLQRSRALRAYPFLDVFPLYRRKSQTKQLAQ